MKMLRNSEVQTFSRNGRLQHHTILIFILSYFKDETVDNGAQKCNLKVLQEHSLSSLCHLKLSLTKKHLNFTFAILRDIILPMHLLSQGFLKGKVAKLI